MNVPTKQRADLVDMPLSQMPIGMRVIFDPPMYERCKQIAGILAKGEGFTPRHLLGKTEACFAVVVQSITWRMSPWSLARETYQTPGGDVGFMGRVIQAVLESSGFFEGGIKFEHYGDWSKIQGRHKMQRSQKGKDYPVAGWDLKDEEGLGVEVIGNVIGEVEPRTFRLDLKSCQPRNSTLWALRPDQQICYTAVRQFASVCAPHILLGVKTDVDPPEMPMRDITPANNDIVHVHTEIAGTDEPEEPVGPTAEDAEQLGREDRRSGKPLMSETAVPANLLEAWKKGWRSEDKAITDAAKAEPEPEPDGPTPEEVATTIIGEITDATDLATLVEIIDANEASGLIGGLPDALNETVASARNDALRDHLIAAFEAVETTVEDLNEQVYVKHELSIKSLPKDHLEVVRQSYRDTVKRLSGKS